MRGKMWISIGLPNFVTTGETVPEIWRFKGFQDVGGPPCRFLIIPNIDNRYSPTYGGINKYM